MPFGFGGGAKKQRAKSIKVPYSQAIRGGQLLEGKAVGVKGKIEGTSFAVNLMTGPDHKGKEQDDIALHLNYRAKEGWVTNTRIDNNWGMEQVFPIDEDLHKEEEVYIRIEPHDRFFTIYANGKKVGERRFETQLTRVNYITVDGKIELHRVAFEGNFYMVPFEHNLSNGFGNGHTLYITGRPEQEAQQFSIKFVEDDKCFPLFLNARFGDEPVFVRNTLKDGKWQDEERTGEFPFTRGETFDMIVESHQDKFNIFVDGHEVCAFYHRLSPNGVARIELDGNLEVQSISV